MARPEVAFINNRDGTPKREGDFKPNSWRVDVICRNKGGTDRSHVGIIMKRGDQWRFHKREANGDYDFTEAYVTESTIRDAQHQVWKLVQSYHTDGRLESFLSEIGG